MSLSVCGSSRCGGASKLRRRQHDQEQKKDGEWSIAILLPCVKIKNSCDLT